MKTKTDKTTIFADKLAAMFEQVEEHFRQATVENYRNVANAQFESWRNRLHQAEPTREQYPLTYRDLQNPGQYVKIKGGVIPWSWELKQKALVADNWFVDYDQAERDANRSVDQAKQHFIKKQSKKLANATKHCNGIPTLTGSLSFSGIVVQGVLHAVYPHSSFSLHMSMIRNSCYKRGYKSFYQFPARFYGVNVAGQTPTCRISEAWLSDNFHD